MTCVASQQVLTIYDIGVGTGGARGALAPPLFYNPTLRNRQKSSLINHRINVCTVYTSLLAWTCYGKLKTTAKRIKQYR